MADKNSSKFYPAASEEIARMLGLTDSGASASSKPAPVQSTPIPDIVIPPAAVPVQQDVMDAQAMEDAIARDVAAVSGKTGAEKNAPAETLATISPIPRPSVAKAVGKTILAVVPYAAAFAIFLVVYFVWFADPSNRPQIFSSFQRQETTQADDRAKLVAALKKSESGSYAQWIAGYYYNVTDASLVDMDHIAPNKLTNFENYLLKLNPKSNDARGTGTTDADAVLAGVDPFTGQSLSDDKRDIVAQYFDADTIRARTAGVAVSPRITPRVAQASIVAPTPPTTSTAPTEIPSVVSTNDCAENKLRINTSVPGRLEVPVMGVNVPIIWTKDSKNFDTDLKSGVVHYPCTPLPGDIGTSYVSGHSSNYAWAKADYNQVFAKMNDLPDGATFKVTAVGQDGKDIRLFYVVQRKTVYEANDQAQFTNTADSVVALSTCWPLNTTQKRMVAFGKLDRVER